MVVATFAADGPSRCSGLPVSRYSVDALHHALGRDLEALSWRRELHRTPSGGVQPFTYGLFRCPARGGEPDEGGSAGEAPDRRDGSEPPR